MKIIALAIAVAVLSVGQAGAEPQPVAPMPLSAEELAGLSGGAGVTVNLASNQTVTATSSGNTVSAGVVGSGDLTIAENAFSGFDGVGNFVINTGHNNTLQGSVSINVVLPPP